MVGTKNENPFLVSVEIIDHQHKETLGVTINYFFTSVNNVNTCLEHGVGLTYPETLLGLLFLYVPSVGLEWYIC
jgi:hypothetical protein